MPPQPIESRVESLEIRVTQLEQVPARIDAMASQISQLHTEMRAEFSAVRQEIAGQGATLRQEMTEQGATIVTTLRHEMAEQGATLRQEMAEQGEALRQEFRTELRSEIGGLATQMRVLHEEVIGRIALLQEALPRRRKPPRA